MDYKELIRGAYDLHVHSAPDVLPRKMDDLEMACRIRDSGMAGYAIKSHYFCTSERAELVRESCPECDAVGAVVLNSSVGGINPTAVEMAARSGAKIVWFPTCDSSHELSHVFDGDPNKKLPYWAKIIIQMKEDGIQAPAVRILEESNRLKPEVMDVLAIIAKYNMILATSHISHEEAFALVEAARDHGIKNIVVTHVDFPTTFYTIEEQQRFVQMGAVMEHCYTTWASGKVDFEVTKEQIRQIGPENCILATDLGQKTAVYPDEGLLEFAKRLYDSGFTKEEIRLMAVENPKKLLGK